MNKESLQCQIDEILAEIKSIKDLLEGKWSSPEDAIESLQHAIEVLTGLHNEIVKIYIERLRGQ